MKTTKAINFTLFTLATTIIAYVTAFILNALHIVSEETMYAIPVATCMTIIFIIFLRENKSMKSDSKDTTLTTLVYAMVLTLSVGAAALFILGHYDVSTNEKLGDTVLIGIPILSFITGLFHTRYSITVNATVSLLLVYSGIQSVENYLSIIVMLSMVTFLSILVRYIVATVWSSIGKNKISAF